MRPNTVLFLFPLSNTRVGDILASTISSTSYITSLYNTISVPLVINLFKGLYRPLGKVIIKECIYSTIDPV